MIDSAFIESLLEQDESPILEFKREWYWSSDADTSNLGSKWGEFYKDIVSLCNAYVDYVGHERYLIFGFCEKTRNIFNIDLKQIPIISDLRGFRQKIINRLENLINYPPLDLEVDAVEIGGKNILVFKIPSPRRLVLLKSELMTKTRTLDAGAVLVRKGQDSDSIRIADPREIEELNKQFEFYNSQMVLKNSGVIKEKDRSISKTVQLYIEKNSSWSIDVGYPIVVRDWKADIVFELFKISEALGGSKHFLYLHERTSQGKTNAFIKKNDYFDPKLPLIILTDSPSIKDKDKRKENIAQVFKSKHVYFIEEFGLNFLYGDFIGDFERYNLPVFVESFTAEVIEGENSALKVLDRWYACSSSPLMIVKGYGGIGKTTLVKQFLDNINKIDETIGLMFIDSNEIIDGLTRAARSEKKIDDLYDFYSAQNQREEFATKSFSKDLLKLSVDNGSLIIVLDGIDEVIAKLGSKFDIAAFISSIVGSYSDNMERGKILVTCRDNFWREVDPGHVVNEITLLPFNEKLADDFFVQAFKNNRFKVNKAMVMAQKLALKLVSDDTSDEAIYVPYILDLIVYLIKHEEEFGDEEVQLVTRSKILNLKNSNDFLVGSVCGREIKKLSNYDIDTQINFLIDFSLSKSGYISLYDVKAAFERSTSIQISDEFVEKLTGHPLLSCTDNKLYFRYDFFYDYFKALYLVRYFINYKIELLDVRVIEILNSYVGFDNDFSRSISERIILDDDFELMAVETVDELKKRLTDEASIDKSILQGAISAILALWLTMQWRQKNIFDSEVNTKILKDLHLKENSLDGVYVFGLNSSARAKPIFDFRGMTIRSSHFEGYEHFWDCSIDEKTRFLSSSFIDLEPGAGVRIKIHKNTFDSSCDVSDIAHHISKREREVIDEQAELKDKLTQFFKLFHDQGNFYPKKQDDVRARIYTGKLLPVLLKNKVIIDYKDPKKPTLRQYKVSDPYKTIVNIFEQGGKSVLEFERVAAMFN
ncbi:hypothetical protein [Delftia sp. CH05]|uniref:hypothetical protein n=1 Tax=Delftia sp. CH05 TaxID=2692194 RepID=UPI00135DB077|nr:hypothetical protein [Delftia sp. CH05]MXN29480.1 hypothetical protein [Delftia sp. CH05]